MPRYLRHSSNDPLEVTDHIQAFLARMFRGSVAKSTEPRLQTLTRAQAQPGGSSGAAPAPAGGGSSGVSILSGDVTGQAQNTAVSSLQGITLTITSPVTGQVLVYTGAAFVNTATLPATLTLAEGVNLVLGTTTGSKIGTGTTQKLGFFNATPVVQQVGASAAGIAAITDANAKAAVSALQSALAALGLVTAPP